MESYQVKDKSGILMDLLCEDRPSCDRIIMVDIQRVFIPF